MFDHVLADKPIKYTRRELLRGNFQCLCEEQLGIEIAFVEPGDKYIQANGLDTYDNRSYCIGKDKIVVGIYEDDELFLVSFYHELAHCLFDYDRNTSIYAFEQAVWENTFKLLEEHDYKISDNTAVWCLEQLNSYKECK